MFIALTTNAPPHPPHADSTEQAVIVPIGPEKSVQNYWLRNHTKNQTKVDKERRKATLSANQRKMAASLTKEQPKTNHDERTNGSTVFPIFNINKFQEKKPEVMRTEVIFEPMVPQDLQHLLQPKSKTNLRR